MSNFCFFGRRNGFMSRHTGIGVMMDNISSFAIQTLLAMSDAKVSLYSCGCADTAPLRRDT